MINSHKEFVEEVQNFCNKMDFIKHFIYNTDASKLLNQIEQLDSRGFILTLNSANMDEEYNLNLDYGFSIVADTLNNQAEFLNTEEENLFCVSALDDYMNHVLDTPSAIANLDLASDSTSGETRAAITGTITFTIKRTASYWKKMDAFYPAD